MTVVYHAPWNWGQQMQEGYDDPYQYRLSIKFSLRALVLSVYCPHLTVLQKSRGFSVREPEHVRKVVAALINTNRDTCFNRVYSKKKSSDIETENRLDNKNPISRCLEPNFHYNPATLRSDPSIRGGRIRRKHEGKYG